MPGRRGSDRQEGLADQRAEKWRGFGSGPETTTAQRLAVYMVPWAKAWREYGSQNGAGRLNAPFLEEQTLLLPVIKPDGAAGDLARIGPVVGGVDCPRPLLS